MPLEITILLKTVKIQNGHHILGQKSNNNLSTTKVENGVRDVSGVRLVLLGEPKIII